MKLSRILFIVISFCAVTCFAQEAKWTRIEFEKTVSVSVPDGFLVDMEKNDKNRKYRIFYCRKDFQVWLSVFNHNYSKDEVKHYKMNSNDSEYAEIDKVVARRLISDTSKIKLNMILIGTKKYYYEIRLHMQNTDSIDAKRFIDSVRINGKQAFPQKLDLLGNEKVVSDFNLQTSVEVLNILNRKIDESEEYNQFATLNELLKEAVQIREKDISLPIILEQPSQFLPDQYTAEFSAGKNLGEITTSVLIKANGEMGKISVFSTANEIITKAVVKAIRSIKFLPAKLDGVNVDYNYVIHLNFYVKPSSDRIIGS
jgi:Gram-negative bacterial TonB protein C-terminal